MSNITPIPTRYAGCHFRSRLEARWAVLFSYLKVPWEYEPEGYNLGSVLGCYLPDFRLNLGRYGIAWVEVKPPGQLDNVAVNKLMSLCIATRMDGYFAQELLDQDTAYDRIQTGTGTTTISYREGSAIVEDGCYLPGILANSDLGHLRTRPSDGAWLEGFDHHTMDQALEVARSTRFE